MTETTPVWELSKENAAPLQRGRNVAVLESTLAETDETRAVKGRKVDSYEQLVHASEQDSFAPASDSPANDPVNHWLSYIKFHQESFPTDTHTQFLLMERCFRALSRFRRYANDPRFIRLCCLYASKTERPNEIFQYLYQQKIGAEMATFWIAWGFVAEKQGEYTFANDVYSKGIRKQAKPVELLNRRYRQFQRRMTRHWLDATQTPGDDENSSANRGVLGALSEEDFHRNDRSTTQHPGPTFLAGNEQGAQSGLRTFVDQSAASRIPQSSNEPVANSFAVFEDSAAPSNPLDDSLLQGDIPYRQLEREADRKKENTLEAERWNERGGYAPTYNPPRPASRPRATNPPPFPVFVDEECVAQQKKEEARRDREQESHRRARDDRTFREREDLCVGDALFKDPLRYVRDPSQLVLDQQAQSAPPISSRQEPSGTKGTSKANAGFSTRLLRDSDTGEEQCFEEARAKAKYFRLVSSAADLNHLVTPEPSYSNDSMSMDDDVSMTEESERSHPPLPKRPFSERRKSLSIHHSRSMELPTPRNSSNASSTVEEAAVLPSDRNEPTINTQLALRELSMMFSSPALGLNDSTSEALDRSGGLGPILNSSGVSEPAEDRSMGAIEEETENHGTAKNPEARTSKIPEFEDKALRTLRDDPTVKGTGCQSNHSRRTIGPIAQEDVFDGMPINEISSEAGFTFYSEVRTETPAEVRDSGFSIYDETERKEKSKKTIPSTFSIYNEENVSDENGLIDESGLIQSIQAPTSKRIRQSTSAGETNQPHQSIFAIFQEEDHIGDEGDTATLSLFDDAMHDLGDGGTTGGDLGSSVSPSGVNKRRRSDSFEEQEEVLTGTFGDISCIMPSEDCTETFGGGTAALQDAVDFGSRHEQDVKGAIQRLSARSVSFPKNRKSLEKILSTKDFVCNLPSHPLPQPLRTLKSVVSPGTKIVFGRSVAAVKLELGRGTYGRVVMLEPEGSADAKAAVKAQSPAGSLAWEYEILEKLRDRTADKYGPLNRVPFPVPLSYLALADGAMLTMEAVSSSGLNFVDLINVYRKKDSPGLPEILALHYVSRMLEALENLHWFGKILHCDTKADNWVLSPSGLMEGEVIKGSDVMLTDFGRAIDLQSLETSNTKALDIHLRGPASREDMMCVAMRKGLPWSFDIDTYGLCDTAHLLLFGSNLELVRNTTTGRWGPKLKPRRYHQIQLWNTLFDTLLNLEEPGKAAIGSRPGSLSQIRAKFEVYLRKQQSEVKERLKHQATFLPKNRSEVSR